MPDKIGLVVLLTLALLLTACSAEPNPTIAPQVSVEVGLIGKGPEATSKLAIGQPAPDFGWRESQNGPESSLAKLQGQPLVLNWWASWCEPCRDEFPLLTQAAQANRTKLVVIGINLKENKAEVADFAARYKPGFKLLRDEQALLSATYGLRGLPQTIFIDRAGQVKAIVRGSLTAQSLSENIKLILEPSGSN